MKNICVYSSSSDILDKTYFEHTALLGKRLAKEEYNLVYGGAKIGLMGEIARSVKSNGGHVTGVIPEKLYSVTAIVNNNCDELVITKDMLERKNEMAKRSDAFIALPGGLGTLEEILEIISLKQLGYHDKPIIFFNINNFYEGLLSMFSNIYKEKFADEDNKKLYHVATNLNGLIDYLKNYKPYIIDIQKKLFKKG